MSTDTDTDTNTETVSFYGHWICPFATRVAFALAQRGIEHNVVNVPPLAVRGPDFALPSEFVANSPRLEIPMLRIGPDYLADSMPILEWMEQRIAGSSLMPSDDNGRAEVRQRSLGARHHLPVISLALCKALRCGVHGGAERCVDGLHGRAEIGH